MCSDIFNILTTWTSSQSLLLKMTRDNKHKDMTAERHKKCIYTHTSCWDFLARDSHLILYTASKKVSAASTNQLLYIHVTKSNKREFRDTWCSQHKSVKRIKLNVVFVKKKRRETFPYLLTMKMHIYIADVTLTLSSLLLSSEVMLINFNKQTLVAYSFDSLSCVMA